VPDPSVPYFPVSLKVSGQPCLVVGGGPVAARKAGHLLECGALITVVAPAVGPDMQSLAPLTIEQRPYAAGEAANFRLVVTATGDPVVDGAVYADAEAAGVWVNSADDPAHCSFILPSVHRSGLVSIAVSTSGSSPALATWLRRQIGTDLGDGLGELAELLAEARNRVRESGRRTEDVDWSGLLNGPLPSLVRDGKVEEAQALIELAIVASS
jgi:siroheme synthase-like protein